MNTLALFGLLLAAFCLLALSQFSHFRAAFNRPPSERQGRCLQCCGLGLIIFAVVIATVIGGSYGVIELLTLLTPAALLVLLLVKQRPCLLPGAALMAAPALCLLWL